MVIPTLNAASLQRELIHGRTKPCIFLCEDGNGNLSEYVVKLKAGMETRENGLAAELISSQLADFFDIPTPAPAIINLDPILAEAIPQSDLFYKMLESEGMNFGSKVITGGFKTWPVDESIPSNLHALAVEIFCFDALIQNPDRRVTKPNVLWKGDELFIIDHEMAFSFIYSVNHTAKPWEISKLVFMQEHLFYRKLKGQSLNFDRFTGALELLSIGVIKTITENIPKKWQRNNISKITDHLIEIVNHVNDFIDQIRRVLL